MSLTTAVASSQNSLFRAASRIATFDPVGAIETRRARSIENGVAPLVIFVVAIVVILAIAAVMSIAVLIFCSQKGMNFEWYAKTSLFELKIACRR